MEYLIKKLGSQEMGSIDKHATPQRGKYFLISKKDDILSFFPPLQQTQKNDFLLLPIVPLDREVMTKIYSNYVYHNDKYHGSTAKVPRDEFRLYLNRTLDPNRLTYRPNDIVIFRKEILENKDDEGEIDEQLIYFLYHVEENTPEHAEITSYLNGETYILFNENIDFVEEKITELMNLKENDFKALVDETIKKEINKRPEGLQNLFNASMFRDFVLEGYNKVCAVTGISIKYENFFNIEAAHIQPKSHAGTYEPRNGLALSRDIHWAFDKGFFTLEDDYTIKVHPDVESHFLNSYNNKKITTPKDDFFKPSKNSLEYHRNNIYGLFKQTGRL